MNRLGRSNVGTVDALIRITVGLAFVGAGSSRRFAGPVSVGMLLLGGLGVAEGLLRWDPLWEALGVDTSDDLRLRANPYGVYPTYEEEAEAFETTGAFKRKALRWPSWRRSNPESDAKE